MFAEISLLYLTAPKTNWTPTSYTQQYITYVGVTYTEETTIA
jgi:hypothetical protein